MLARRHAVENIKKDLRIFDRRKVDQSFEKLIMLGFAVEQVTVAVHVRDEEQLVQVVRVGDLLILQKMIVVLVEELLRQVHRLGLYDALYDELFIIQLLDRSVVHLADQLLLEAVQL